MRKACKLSLVCRSSTSRTGEVRILDRDFDVLSFKSLSALMTDAFRVEGMVGCSGECEVM